MRRRDLAFKIATPALVLLLAELAARHVVDVRTRLAVAEQRTLAAYRGMPWASQYFSDVIACVEQSKRAHHPRYARYVLQDINEDCHTATVNYANRLRQTWNPAPPDRATATSVTEVGMFGGSTMEGLGAIDDETIPSALSHEANYGAAGVHRYHVTNYGVSSYTFTQSVFKLMTLLRDGHHFDSVVFYGGANDIDYAYELGEVGGLFGEDVARTRLEGSLWDQVAAFSKDQANSCVLCLGGLVAVRNAPVLKDYLPRYLVRMRDWLHFKKGQVGGDDVDPMATAIAQYYAQSHALLTSVAQAYHIEVLEFWQPSLMEDTYAPGEARLANSDPRLSDNKLRRLYARTHDKVVALHLDHFWDLSHALEGRPSAVYLDAVHISGEGNRVIAHEMHEVLR